MNPGTLQPLVAKLRGCPAQEERITEKQFIETWDNFKQIAPEHGDTISSAMMVGVILYDPEIFASLLTKAEHGQLITLGLTAAERYRQRSNPPNKLGKLIVATVKETI